MTADTKDRAQRTADALELNAELDRELVEEGMRIAAPIDDFEGWTEAEKRLAYGDR